MTLRGVAPCADSLIVDETETMPVSEKISRTVGTFAVAALICWLPGPTPVLADPGLREAIRAEAERLRESGRLSVDGIRIAAVALVPDVYERRGFAPGWRDPEKIGSLLTAIRSSELDGLDPHDYGLERIAALKRSLEAGRTLSPRAQAGFDLLLTDSLIRLTYHLRFGAVDPATMQPSSAFVKRINELDPAAAIREVMDATSVPAALASLVPRGPHYHRLQSQLQRHRVLAEAGGWPDVPDGPSLSPGARDPRLSALALRLAKSGDLSEHDASIPWPVYDEALQGAVRRFQRRHGLEVDAVVGPATLSALNVPIEARIEQIRLNLERARWVFDGPQGDDFVLVNIAEFRAYVIRDGEAVWTTRVIVGETDDQTPVFRSTMKYLVFNPTWTVPHRIASKELLPKIKQDPGFLARGRYDLLDPAGNPVEPSGVDWRVVNADDFRFTLVQQPGPANQLGQIKFVFPNQYSICMHDTPAKSLFARAERDFSHGCIRVDEPFALAEVLLRNDGWTRESIHAQIESTETKTVFLAKPLPVLLVYWTAVVDDLGTIHFYGDIYERDDVLLAALDRPHVKERP